MEVALKVGKLFSQVTEAMIPEFGSSRRRQIKILATINLDKPLLRGTNLKLNNVVCWVDLSMSNLLPSVIIVEELDIPIKCV